jgi:hypothetical protein
MNATTDEDAAAAAARRVETLACLDVGMIETSSWTA